MNEFQKTKIDENSNLLNKLQQINMNQKTEIERTSNIILDLERNNKKLQNTITKLKNKKQTLNHKNQFNKLPNSNVNVTQNPNGINLKISQKIVCYKCKGTKEARDQCPLCKGNGVNNFLGSTAFCNRCSGTGFIDKCNACNGKGENVQDVFSSDIIYSVL